MTLQKNEEGNLEIDILDGVLIYRINKHVQADIACFFALAPYLSNMQLDDHDARQFVRLKFWL